MVPAAEPGGQGDDRVGTGRQHRFVERLVYAVLVLNLIDAVMTMIWVLRGDATEANPMMEVVLREHPVLFVATKLGLVSLGSYLLWQHRRKGAAVIAIFVAFLVYYAILTVHLGALDLRVVSRLLGAAG
jgi:hypothetical protein